MEQRRSALNQKFSNVMDNLQSRVLTASQTLNDITGYSAIDSIKADNEKTEASLNAAQDLVRSARAAYKTSNSKRAATQREVTTLLARKDSWSPADLERFTALYRTDHELEGAVTSAQEALTEAEVEEQSLNQRLNAGILKRYHEEQIWSDRIRRASTWGTWGLMGMNFLLFVVLQFFAEPWRRRRLVRGVVEQEKEVLEGVRGEMEELKTTLEKRIQEAVGKTGGVTQVHETMPMGGETAATIPSAAAAAAAAVGSWRDVLADPAKWQAAASDLCSDRVIGLRMKDASALVLQGALAGAAIVGSIAMLVARG
jgi:sensitive to high expression protein 9